MDYSEGKVHVMALEYFQGAIHALKKPDMVHYLSEVRHHRHHEWKGEQGGKHGVVL
jgi:exopolysaccharide biosynthesis predicted pyruvyltransferase EpsI